MSLTTATLGEIAAKVGGSIQTGPFGSQLHSSDYQDEGIPVVMPQDIVDDRISVEAIARISETMAEKLARHKLKAGDIIYPRRGDLNKRALITSEQAGWLCGTGCIKINIRGGELIPHYLFYYLKQPQVVKWIEQKGVGATMLNLNSETLSSVVVKFPAENVQRRIVGILGAYDDLMANNERRIGLLAEAMHLLYREWFGRLRFPGWEETAVVDGVPDGWEKRPLGAIAEEMTRRIHPTDVQPDTPYVGLEHIPRQTIALQEWGSSSDVTSDKFSFAKGEILFGKIRPYFHKVVFAPVSGICSSDTIIIQPRAKDYFPITLAVASSEMFVRFASKTSKDGSKMPRANWKVMREYSVLIPPKELLDTFNNFVFPIVAQIETLIFATHRLREARDALLPRLMSGRIEV
ncbi:MAG: restriction endonuclease subunit S [Anaerolineae bacterium]|nr:restriction endonuclease subunit S [Anaerolineae bacterium]